MILENLDIRSVNHNQPRISRSPSNHSFSVSKEQLTHVENEHQPKSESSDSTPQTVVKWSTPPQSPLRNSEIRQPEAVATHPITSNVMVNGVRTPPQVHLSNPELHSTAVQASGTRAMDGADDSGSITPVDDTQFIRFALEQLSLDLALRRPSSAGSNESYPVDRIIPREGLVQEYRHVGGPSLINITPFGSRSEVYIPLEAPIHTSRHPNLTFLPRILRPFSMIVWIFLYLLMIAGLMFCAIYSSRRNGLTNYIAAYDGIFFVFNFLPQILGAILFVLIECIMAAVYRVVPFAMMASEHVDQRKHAPFLGLYPRSPTLPRIDYIFRGQPVIGVCSVFLSGMPLTIPLLSSAFSVGNVNGTFRYSAVEGVVWTLVVIYIFAALALIGIATYFFWRTTGLIWDIRSLADIIALLSRSNSLDEYQDTEIVGSREELKRRLPLRSDRLGYWRTTNPTQDIFYCIGEEGASTRRYTVRRGRVEKHLEGDKDNEFVDIEGLHAPVSRGTESSLLAKVYSPAIRFRYIPWFLNDTFIILWPISALILYLAVLIVSFLPSTAIAHGFSPLLAARIDAAAFSPANFLYSFIPSLLGMILYTFFESISLTVARLTPWASLSHPDGALPANSILLDYPASLTIPFATIISALSNGDTLIALLAFFKPLMLLLPVLAGGVFFPFVAVPSNTLLIFPDMPVFYLLLVLLGLYLLSLVLIMVKILSSRRQFHLPKPVTCLAEIVSFLYASELLHDAAFRAVRSKVDLRTRLVGARERTQDGRRGEEVRFSFGIFKGRDGRSHLGVERVGRGLVPERERGELRDQRADRPRSRFST